MSEKPTRRCFVLMPFAPRFREVYDQVYKPVCEQNEVECWRVDEIARPGSITRDIVEGIIEADIIIADLTSRNPNVFYELGIAHAVGNKTVMTCQSKEDVPFDIASYRVIFYEQTIAGGKELAKNLDRAIKELLTSLDRTNNPVQEVLGMRSVLGRATRTPLFKVIDLGTLTPRLRAYLRQEEINYLDQLKNLDLKTVQAKYNLGKTSLEKLVAILIEQNFFEDVGCLTQFIVENHLRPIQFTNQERGI